jgi:NadR type nicotinamide-nucleotide adenylyltransferase
VLEAWTGPTATGYTDEIKRRHEAYLQNRLDGWDIDRFYSSERYGKHVSTALCAENRCIDPQRETVPISGTEIRRDTYGNREYVKQRVYRDLVTSVAVLGGPSTGKTTLVERLANEYDTAYMHEYGREYWERHHDEAGKLLPDDLVTIAQRHCEMADKRAHEADEYLFVDTNAIYTRAYARFYHDNVPPRLERLARDCGTRYDVTLLCGTDIPYADTPDRRNERNRTRLQAITRDFLDRHNIPHYVVSGTVEERVSTVERILDTVEQYDARQSVHDG